MIVPYAAGGSSDIIGRVVAEFLEKGLGRPIVIENAGGAGGAAGTQRAVAADSRTGTPCFSRGQFRASGQQGPAAEPLL